MEQKITIIKRYKNRKLYNVRTSAYVTLIDLCDMTRHGEAFIVVDNIDGRDITAATLTQAVHEEKMRTGKFDTVLTLQSQIIELTKGG